MVGGLVLSPVDLQLCHDLKLCVTRFSSLTQGRFNNATHAKRSRGVSADFYGIREVFFLPLTIMIMSRLLKL